MLDQFEAIETLIQNLADAWNSHDLARIKSFYSSNALYVLNNKDEFRGWEAILPMVEEIKSDFPDFYYTIDKMRIAEKHAVFLWTMHGTHSETGQKVRVPGWEELDIDEDMKIFKTQDWYDEMEFERQVQEGYE